MTLACDAGLAVEPPRGDHRVEFYADDAALVDAMAAFVRPVLDGGVALVVATAAHRDAFAAALGLAGVDVTAAEAQGRVVLLDAAVTLDRLSVGGAPDPAAFETVIGGLLDAAAAHGGPVRVYGEMVGVLWERGDIAAAMALEDLWNRAADTRSFSLLCGYPAALFRRAEDSTGLEALCHRHTAVAVAPDETLTQMATGAGWTRPPQAPVVRWPFPAELPSGLRARHQLRRLLAAWDADDLVEDAQLLTTELVNNAVLHARSRVVVEVQLRDDTLRVAVSDSGGGAFHRQEATPRDTHGRGLMLVESVSSSWGTVVDLESKTVWFELQVTDRPAPASNPG